MVDRTDRVDPDRGLRPAPVAPEGLKTPEVLWLAAIAFGPLVGSVEAGALATLEIVIFTLLFLGSLHALLYRSPITKAPIYETFLPAVMAILILGLAQRLNAHSPQHGSLVPFTASAYATELALLRWCAYAALIWCFPQTIKTAANLRRGQRNSPLVA